MLLDFCGYHQVRFFFVSFSQSLHGTPKVHARGVAMLNQGGDGEGWQSNQPSVRATLALDLPITMMHSGLEFEPTSRTRRLIALMFMPTTETRF